MTEERMICRAIKATHGEVTEIRYYPEEPAPPKDWKPYCFSDFDKDGKCEHDEYYMMASCDKCPFTK